MYYGTGTTNNINYEDVWDLNYIAVHHLEEKSNIIYDSTDNDMDGIPHGNVNQEINGRIGNAYYFDGINDNIILPQIFSNENQFTMEAWIYPQSGARVGAS